MVEAKRTCSERVHLQGRVGVGGRLVEGLAVEAVALEAVGRVRDLVGEFGVVAARVVGRVGVEGFLGRLRCAGAEMFA